MQPSAESDDSMDMKEDEEDEDTNEEDYEVKVPDEDKPRLATIEFSEDDLKEGRRSASKKVDPATENEEEKKDPSKEDAENVANKA